VIVLLSILCLLLAAGIYVANARSRTVPGARARTI
jgi:hypothetical protein